MPDFGSNFMDILLWTFWLFCFFAWMWLLVVVFSDLFSDKGVSGGKKTLWTLFIIFFSFIGLLSYLIARGGGMAERQEAKARAVREAQDSYIKSVASATNPADQIAQGKQLLDSGAITQDEFDAIKVKALA